MSTVPHPRPRLRERLPRPATVAWLTLVWVLLWGDLSWGNVVNGVLLAVLVCVVFPLPRVGTPVHVRPLAVVVLTVRFVVDVLAGAFQVTWVALRPAPPRPAVIRVALRSHSDVMLATTAGLTSLIPGSVVVEVHRLSGELYLHVLDVPRRNPQAYLDHVRRRVVAQEERLLRAFATDAELRDAGYRPSWRVGAVEEGVVTR